MLVVQFLNRINERTGLVKTIWAWGMMLVRNFSTGQIKIIIVVICMSCGAINFSSGNYAR